MTALELALLISDKKIASLEEVLPLLGKLDQTNHVSSGSDTLAHPMLTDLYQITMAYAYWSNGRHMKPAAFDLFFRRHPFKLEWAIAGGIRAALEFASRFRFDTQDIECIRKLFPYFKPEFFEWLASVDCHDVKIYGIGDGMIASPRVPMIRLEGPLAILQLLETGLLNIINFSTLISTNARRFRMAAGTEYQLLEFGARRGQGPEAALLASRYSYMAGFDGTSNVRAHQLYDIPARGSMAHAYVQSHTGLHDVTTPTIVNAEGAAVDFLDRATGWRDKLYQLFELDSTNDGELAAFITYAQAHPNRFLAILDTYDTLRSGVPNMLAVAIALYECGYTPQGGRLDSGDLAHNSVAARAMFERASQLINKRALAELMIVASNDLTVEIINSLKQQNNSIDAFGIGTHLVTCQDQPALGGVYKLVEIDGQPVIKLSEEPIKMTLPGRKAARRLIGQDGKAILDLLSLPNEEVLCGTPIMCIDPTQPHKRVRVSATQIVALDTLLFNGHLMGDPETIEQQRARVNSSMAMMREDHLRQLNPTPYKVSVTEPYLRAAEAIWEQHSPVATLT